jgi:hypothetical protein
MTRILSAVEHFPDQSGRMGRDNGIGLRTFILALRYTRMRNGDVKSLSVPGFVAGALNTTATQARSFISGPRLHLAYRYWYLATQSKKSLQASEGFPMAMRIVFEIHFRGIAVGRNIHRGGVNPPRAQQHQDHTAALQSQSIGSRSTTAPAGAQDPIVQAQGAMSGRLRGQGKSLIN